MFCQKFQIKIEILQGEFQVGIINKQEINWFLIQTWGYCVSLLMNFLSNRALNYYNMHEWKYFWQDLFDSFQIFFSFFLSSICKQFYNDLCEIIKKKNWHWLLLVKESFIVNQMFEIFLLITDSIAFYLMIPIKNREKVLFK